MGLEATGKGVAGGGGFADERVVLKHIADIATASLAFGVEARVEGFDQCTQGGFAVDGKNFTQQLGTVASGKSGASVAGGQGVGHVAQKSQQERGGGRDVGGACGGGKARFDFGDGEKAIGGGQLIAQGLFNVIHAGGREFSTQVAVEG